MASCDPTYDAVCRAARTLREDIITVDDFIQNPGERNKLNSRSGAFEQKKKELDDAIATEQPEEAIAALKEKMTRDFGATEIMVHDGKESRPYTIPNPLMAREERQKAETTFAMPASALNRTNRGKNAAIVHKLLPSNMLTNLSGSKRSMIIAFLDGIAYCGQSPDISSDPRCLPVRVVGEMREFAQLRNQAKKTEAAKSVAPSAIVSSVVAAAVKNAKSK